MKKFVLLAALALALTLTACGGNKETPAASDPGSASVSTPAVSAPAAPVAPVIPENEKADAPATPAVTPVPDPVPEYRPGAEVPAEPVPAPEVTPEPEKEPEPSVEPAPEVTPAPDASETTPPAHTHEYENTVVNPTCTKDGYTEHKCSCGESYKDNVKSATGHKYNDKVVAPTTSEKGYTLHTCSVCGDSYKDNYTDKLPTEKPGKDEYVNDGGQSTSSEEKAGLVAGKMADGEAAKVNRPAPNPNADKNTAMADINNVAFYSYGGLRFFDDGIAQNYEDEGKFAKFVTHADGRTGINVFGWRKSYDSSITTNSCLNVVLEAFYYMTGDRAVAKALWNVVDYMSINGNTIANDKIESFGFAWSNETNSSIELSMNGVHILWTWYNGAGSDTFYFD